jgi:hypothetical protein
VFPFFSSFRFSLSLASSPFNMYDLVNEMITKYG